MIFVPKNSQCFVMPYPRKRYNPQMKTVTDESGQGGGGSLPENLAFCAACFRSEFLCLLPG
jgi:hypothetical protein